MVEPEVQRSKPGPLGAEMDELARNAGGWPDGVMCYAVQVIGEGENPGVLMTGSAAKWMPKKQRWNFKGQTKHQAVVKLDEYRAAIAKAKAGAL